MFKWPKTPRPGAQAHELADYAELSCWQNARASRTALGQDLGRMADNDYADGVQVEDDWTVAVGEAIAEIQRRREVCREGYPFVVDKDGTFARYDTDALSDKVVIYKFLLLATRLDMSKSRKHAAIDGATLFEHVAAEVARTYLGARTEKFVFGASVQGTDFASRVGQLCQCLGEGEGFRKAYANWRDIKDDKLDIVVWKAFADHLAGKLIAFGQCKTGTSYQEALGELQPEAFCSQWFRAQPAVVPVRLFLIADALSPGRFEMDSRKAGVLFDRCRIIDFCEDRDGEVMDQVKCWTAAAAQFAGLPDR